MENDFFRGYAPGAPDDFKESAGIIIDTAGIEEAMDILESMSPFGRDK